MASRLRNASLSVLLVVLAIVFGLIYVILMPLISLFEEVSGNGRRYRRLRARMVDERPPLPDPDFLRAVAADEADAPLWLGVRSCLGEYCGVPPEALHPGDAMAEIWWMHWDGPDFLDLVFRLERKLGVKIPYGDLEPAWRETLKGNQEFGEFAGLTVKALRRITG